MTIRRILIALAVLALVVAAIAYSRRPAVVETVAPSRGDAAEIVYASGVVEPRIWAKVTSLVRERIVELCNCEAQTIEQGVVLARLDNTEATATLNELEARLRLEREDMSRMMTLFERRVISDQAVDRARSEVDRSEALIAAQKARLENYTLRAPSAGVVLRQDGEVGEIAEPGNVLFWVGQPTPLLVVADVNEEDIPRVAVGQRVMLRAEAFPGQLLEGVVDSITPKGDPVTKTYRVRVKLPDDTPLRIGMSTDVNVVTRVAKDVLLVPSLAMRGDELYAAEAGRARLRKVKTGIRGIQAIEVQSGLDQDAQVITPFPEALTEGARIEIKRD
jgi:membrane fusion protein (multidrug efflux system)